MMVTQHAEGQGKEPEHTHPAVTHSHDHWHISHHVGAEERVEHRVYWHTHAHNHNELVHSHDYARADEEQHHAQEAHIHDHAAPTGSGT
jgi:hypothetical protein